MGAGFSAQWSHGRTNWVPPLRSLRWLLYLSPETLLTRYLLGYLAGYKRQILILNCFSKHIEKYATSYSLILNSKYIFSFWILLYHILKEPLWQTLSILVARFYWSLYTDFYRQHWNLQISWKSYYEHLLKYLFIWYLIQRYTKIGEINMA